MQPFVVLFVLQNIFFVEHDEFYVTTVNQIFNFLRDAVCSTA